MGKLHDSRGFTLIEIMAAVAIVGILMAISIPPIYHSMDSAASRQDTEALAGRLRLARSQALSSYADVVVYFNLDGNGTYSVHIDNGGGTGIPDDPDFEITNKNNGEIDENEVLGAAVNIMPRSVFGYLAGTQASNGDNLDSPFGFDGDPPRITFHADGTASEDGWIAIMPFEDFLDQKEGRNYLVEIRSATGEISVVRAVL